MRRYMLYMYVQYRRTPITMWDESGRVPPKSEGSEICFDFVEFFSFQRSSQVPSYLAFSTCFYHTLLSWFKFLLWLRSCLLLVRHRRHHLVTSYQWIEWISWLPWRRNTTIWYVPQLPCRIDCSYWDVSIVGCADRRKRHRPEEGLP